MQAGLHALLEQVLDYAGLFPPARLDLDPAIRNYARYRAEPENWMLGRFICPAGRLHELDAYGDELFLQDPPFRFSVLGRGGADETGFFENLELDLRDINSFRTADPQRVKVEAFEVRVPNDMLETPALERFEAFFRRTFDEFNAAELSDVRCAFELPRGLDWDERLAAATGGLQKFDVDAQRLWSLKLRCGGAEPGHFPSSAEIALAIEAARDAEVPLKFTAGLHHPFQHHDPGVRACMHGFINVFVAGVLAQAVALDHHDIRGVLDEQDPRAFTFSEQVVGWNEAEATVDDIRFARRRFVLGFGSCSFDEPRDELKQVGLLS